MFGDPEFSREENQNEKILRELAGINEEFDELLRKLKEKDVKLGWEIERLQIKENELLNKSQENNNNNDYFSFSMSFFEKQSKNVEINRNPHKNENNNKSKPNRFELQEKENRIIKETNELKLREKELQAKFEHMQSFHNDFLKTKQNFQNNSQKYRNLSKKIIEKEEELQNKEKILLLKEDNYFNRNGKLSEIIKKLNIIYEENENNKLNSPPIPLSPKSLPSINNLITKRPNFNH